LSFLPALVHTSLLYIDIVNYIAQNNHNIVDLDNYLEPTLMLVMEIDVDCINFQATPNF
jgi:hypothetical protein